MSNLSFRPYLPGDGEHLADLVWNAVEELAQEHYDDDQRSAWAGAITQDMEAFEARLAAGLTIIAMDRGETLGFIALKGTDQIDLLYVAADHARRGVGGALCEVIETLAGRRGAKAVTVDASDAARDFFEKRGFVAAQRNSVMCNGEWLANTTMKKTLPDDVRKGTA